MKVFILIITILIISVFEAYSFRIYPFLTFGYNNISGSYWGQLPEFNSSPSKMNISGEGYFWGFKIDFVLGRERLFHSLVFDVSINKYDINTYTEIDKMTAVYNEKEYMNDTMQTKSKFNSELVLRSYTLSVLPKFDLFYSNFYFIIGPSLELFLKQHTTNSENLLEPEYVRFSRDAQWEEKGWTYQNNDKTVVYYDGESQNLTDYRVSLNAGICYEFKWEKVWITPGIYYNYALNYQDNDKTLRYNIIKMAVDIMIIL